MIIDLDDAGEEFAKFLIHAEERKYDPAKRKEYYERTKKLKGRRTRMLTNEDRAAVNKDEKNVRQGKTSAKLEKLEAKLLDLDLKQRQMLVYAIQGRVSPEEFKRVKEQIDAEELKTRDQIYNEKNNLTAIRALKGTPAFVKDYAKDNVDLVKRLLDPNNKKPLTFDRTMNRISPPTAWDREIARVDAEIAKEKKAAAQARTSEAKKKNARNKS